MKIRTSIDALNKAVALEERAADLDFAGIFSHAARLEKIADGYRHIAAVLKAQEDADILFEQLETRLRIPRCR